MLGTFLDEATKLFGRRYVLAAWAPTFLATLLSSVPIVLTLGVSRELHWWNRLGGTEQIIIGFVALVAIAAIAYLLQALPLVQLYEGYVSAEWISRLGVWLQQAHYDTYASTAYPADGGNPNTNEARAAWAQLVSDYPRDREHVMPTRLGNMFRSAETYPATVYGMDGSLWWPRLAPLLPTEYRTNLDEALTPVLALLTASFALIVGTVSACAFLLLASQSVVRLVATFLIGITLSWLAYRATVAQARNYCQWFRTGFDLYRNRLWKHLRLAPPADLPQEWRTWEKVERWIHEFDVPMLDSDGYPPIAFLDDPPTPLRTLQVRSAQSTLGAPNDDAAEIEPLPVAPNAAKRFAGRFAGVVGLAIAAAALGVTAGCIEQPWSDRVLTVRSDQRNFGLLGSVTQCTSVALPTDDAISCSQPPDGRVLATTVARSAGDYLRARDVVELPAGEWTVVEVPAGSPRPTGGEPTWIMGTLKSPDGTVTPIQVDGIALGRKKANLVVALTTADSMRLAPAIAGAAKTVVAVRALGAPPPWGSSA